MEDKLIEGFAYALPALVAGGVAYLMFSSFLQRDENEKKHEALVTKKKESLPIKLQAYERLLLFCERINPAKLLTRVNPIGDDVNSYVHLLLANIEQEYEHNLVQQIYVHEDAWKAVVGSKLAIANKIRTTAENSNNAKELRENLLIDYAQVESPTETAIAIIKQQVKKLI
ncbi:DUF7935 family protein [Tenacibaculum jejuense]|uniref:Uncharacterized protein n=1 Tax=Tenacibaculum jejuense TaxID=584609 RepID=A0A238UAK6_9FLAO|nr:hypothetical protein [Tenacibaculum jejuense]SNR16199.1 conserved protein of unknown function [Tenacibaculum jejuense]